MSILPAAQHAGPVAAGAVEGCVPSVDVCGASFDVREVLRALGDRVRAHGIAHPTDAHGRSRDRLGLTAAQPDDAIAAALAFLDDTVCAAQQPACSACAVQALCPLGSAAAAPADGPTVADLFCGAGGLSLGFEQAGFRPVLAVDHDRWSATTYVYNRPWMRVDREVFVADLAMDCLPEPSCPVDVLVAGVPCQPFSTANRQPRAVDHRRHLFDAVLECAVAWRPRAIVIENVAGFRRAHRSVLERFEVVGYQAAVSLVEGAELGLPQRRARMFIVAFRADAFPDARRRADAVVSGITALRERRQPTLADAIDDLPPRRASTMSNRPGHEDARSGWSLDLHRLTGASEYVRALNEDAEIVPLRNHRGRYNNDRDIEIFATLEPGEDSLAPSIAGLMPYARRNHVFKDKYYKLRPDEPCRTITAHMRFDCNSYIHPHQARGLTVREAARIQSFPDRYVFTGTFQRLYQQVGNAVPPLVGRAVATSLGAYL